MELNYSSTKLPTAASTAGFDKDGPIANAFSNPTRITADDGSSASWGAFAALQGASITGSAFDFPALPDSAVIDGIEVYIDGSQTGCYGTISINIPGASTKDLGAFSGIYGGPADLWGLTEIDPADIASITATGTVNDVSGGDGIASIDYMSITVYWHIEMDAAPTDVPTRVDYKMFNSEGDYLGLIPNVTSKLAFSQDINSAGSTIQINAGVYPANETTTEPLLDDSGDPILTDNDEPILVSSTNTIIALGETDKNVMFKNGNRVQVWLYNYWHPNGKLMFSGQVNRVAFKYGGGNTGIQLTVYSDGIDLDNFIARGYPFAYTTEVQQTTTTDKVSLIQNVFGEWTFYGQSFRTDSDQTTVGQIQLMMDGAAWVNVYLMDAPNGNILGSVSKWVTGPINTVVNFDFAQLIPVSPSTDYFIRVTVANNNSIWLYRNTAGGYANGEMYQSDYAGGSGGGSFYPNGGGDLYFVVKSGLPTTTTTYSTDDPVTDMARNILLDYNARGGRITERDFTATGLSLTYTFIVATILDAIKKVIELSPTGYYSYIDLGTAEIDILPTSETADFTIVKSRDINQLDLALTIEQVKNYLLLSGGDTGGGTNLFRQYQDTVSSSRYGIRLANKSDNRITLTATADAVGDSFIEENADETQETSVAVLNHMMDITLLTPGKTIGFRNFGGFIDDMVLQITRRDYTPEMVKITLGRLPTTMPAEIQRINRELQMEQTANNPSAPS